MRIVICDDHQLLLESMASALAQRGIVVEAAVLEPAEAVRAVALHDPDVLLTDLIFPTGSGLDAARQVRDQHPRTKVVVLTGSNSSEALMEALAIGVTGYVRKDQPVPEIVSVLRAVATGGTAVDGPLLKQLNRRTPSIPRQRRPSDVLTARERDVADMLVEGLNTEEIMRRLGVSQSTVRTHVQSILIKLGVHSRLQAVTLLAEEAVPSVRPTNDDHRALR